MTACPAIGIVGGLQVAFARSTATPTIEWTVVACIKAGQCGTATGTPSPRIFVAGPAPTATTPLAVTAYAADSSGTVAPVVTQTVTPSLYVVDPTCGPSAYNATVTVTPTR